MSSRIAKAAGFRSSFGIRRFGLGVLLTLALALSFGTAPANAQSSIAGTVTGQVKDEQGAVVPGVAVKLVELATGATFNSLSNDSGLYNFPTVPPGRYDVTFNKAGFSEFAIRGQEVRIGVVLTANATLKVGSTATTVEVSATAGAELQTMNATVGNTISEQSLLVLPNLGRDATSMAILQPATSPGGQAAGAVGDLNTYQLDGANISDDMGGNVTTYETNFNGIGGTQTGGSPSGVIPTPVESIEELKVSVSNQTSDFNNSSGSQVQMTTKRGTNQFHGSAYMFYFDNAIGEANSWANNHTPFTVGATHFADTPVDYPKNHRSRFGGALGGPLLPKSFLGGKWFFFANYEGLRIPNPGIYNASVPSAALREGIVQVANSAGVYVPYNLTNQTINFNGTPLAPAQCPAGACDPRGLGLNPIVNDIWSKQIPLANNPLGGDQYNTLGFLSTIRTPLTTNNYVGRIDHDFGDKEHFYLSYRDYKLVSLTSSQVDIGGVLPGDQFGTPTAKAPRPQQPSVWTAGLTSTLTPTTTNTFVFSYLRNFWQWSDANGPPQGFGLGGALEISGETSSAGYIPYNVNSQSIRQRFWDGQDKAIRDDMTILKGNHLISFGGSYGRNFDYHSRTDNGAGVNNQISYLSTNAGLNFAGYYPSTVPASGQNSYASLFSYVTGIVSSTQVMYTRALPSLNPLPIGTPATDQSIIPYYSVYWQDTWHMKPSFTLTYGMGWNLEMPPYELQGKQVALVDDSGQPISTAAFLNQRNQASLQGGNYTPELGFELVRNVGTGLKYPYNPYYGEFSPRASFAWNPHYSDGILGKIFGTGKTVVRGGYSRIFGRLNGVDLVLVPLLGPGLLQGVTCVNPLMNQSCGGSAGATPANAFRIGTDGLSAPLAAPSASLPQPFFPGGANPQTVDASSLDPNFRPDRTDNFTLTLQREINNHVQLEVGYIGKLLRNEFQSMNLDSVPINETLSGQSFSQAYAQLYQQLVFSGVAPQNVTAQPFFEAALGGANSAFCKGFASCTQAALTATGFTGNPGLIRNTSVSDLWAKLATSPSWIFGRTTYSQAFNGGNPQATALLMETSNGWANYNAVFVSFRTNAWHGLTTASNFTWGRSMGTSGIVQASSETAALDPFNLNAQYGSQPFDYKFLYNMSMFYETPFFKGQHGVLGHILGGWTIAPIFTAQSGAPTGITYSENTNCNCEAFGEVTTPAGSSASANANTGAEHAVGFMPYTGNIGGHYGVNGSTGNNVAFGAASVGTLTHNGANYGLNFYANPAAVYSEFRPCVLGFDTSCGGVAGPLRGLPTWNLDAQVVKNIGIYKERVGAQLFFTFTNLLNHFQPSTSAGSLTSPTSFGQITGQANSPRSLELGLRVHF